MKSDDDEKEVRRGPSPDYEMNLVHAINYAKDMMDKELPHIHVHVPEGNNKGNRMLYLGFVPPIDASAANKVIIPISFHQPHAKYLSDVELGFDAVYKFCMHFVKKIVGTKLLFPLFPAKACEAANKAYFESLNPSDRERVRKMQDSIKVAK